MEYKIVTKRTTLVVEASLLIPMVSSILFILNQPYMCQLFFCNWLTNPSLHSQGKFHPNQISTSHIPCLFPFNELVFLLGNFYWHLVWLLVSERN